jgi:hypothetical protein
MGYSIASFGTAFITYITKKFQAKYLEQNLGLLKKFRAQKNIEISMESPY